LSKALQGFPGLVMFARFDKVLEGFIKLKKVLLWFGMVWKGLLRFGKVC
jgi:hypothetical protein